MAALTMKVHLQRERQAITEAHGTLRMQLAAALALSANLMTRNAALEKQHLIAAKHWTSDQAMMVSTPWFLGHRYGWVPGMLDVVTHWDHWGLCCA